MAQLIAEYNGAGQALRRHGEAGKRMDGDHSPAERPGVDEPIVTLEGSGVTDIRRLAAPRADARFQ
jgi:hypothetical protein